MLVRSLREKGFAITVRKPVESGCEGLPPNLLPGDARAYEQALEGSIPITLICPYRFKAPLAPPVAAAKEGKTLWLEQLTAACKADSGTQVIVEGAGGLCSPIAQDGLNIDLAVKLNYPLIIIAPNRLGCINHVLLTVETAAHRGLGTACIILNNMEGGVDECQATNRQWLEDHLEIPVHELPFNDDDKQHVEELINALKR